MKAIIIDDEVNCCKALSVLLQRHSPDIEVVATCQNGSEGLVAIQLHSPDIVFLDIQMPGMTGFEMLEKLPAFDFHLVFTTSFDQYALKAFRFSAMDYLLKPIDKDELLKAIEKLKKINKTSPRQVEALLQKVRHPLQAMNKIALPTMEGLQLVPVHSIISCESDDNYTILFLNDRRKIVVSCTLKEIEEMLEDFPFIRVHRSYLVNLNEIEKYVKGEGGYLIMSDGSNIDVSRSRKEDLLKKLQPPH